MSGMSATACRRSVLSAIAALAVLTWAWPGHACSELRALPGHVLPALRIADSAGDEDAARTLTVTLTLRRDDQRGFDAYLSGLYDPQSPFYRHFLTQQEIADRFGPSRDAYAKVAAHLRGSGLHVVDQPVNRLTLTAEGTAAAIEKAFGTNIRRYRIDAREFRANATEPHLPPVIFERIVAISGLSDLARPRPLGQMIAPHIQGALKGVFDALVSWMKKLGKLNVAEQLGNAAAAASTGGSNNGTVDPPEGWLGNDGTGQTIGVLAFDTFERSDIADFLAIMSMPPSQMDKLSEVHVEGGATPGEDQDEVLLDVTAIMSVAPGAEVVVYDGPFTGRNTSFQRIFNRMIEDEVTIITNSWAYCENQTTEADVESIDMIFQNAAMAGITVLNASGDTGSTCLNGSPNTAAVPASSPSATAVGGTTLSKGPAFLYLEEEWWNGIGETPPTGQGGFGTSAFFERPAYQDGFTDSTMRSIPDVVVNADPARGVVLCQASDGGCPSGKLYGGTSVAAPIWAAFVAVLNQAQGSDLGAINPLFYPLAETDAFHDAESMGSDFAHVGLGSPNLNVLHLELAGKTPGAMDVEQSRVLHAYPIFDLFIPPLQALTRSTDVPADGETPAFIFVQLRDADGNTIPGKTISLAVDGGSAVIEPDSATTNVSNGAVVFTATNLTAETVRFTATNETDGGEVGETDEIVFAVPPATSAGIQAFPTTVTADGIATTTITVTLQDVLGRPTPGKLVTLSQGSGHSVIQAPDPAVTDDDGQIEFIATNTVNETVTYTAVDVTDGDLAIPGNAMVMFNNGSPSSCGSGIVPTAAPGFSLTPFANGFVAGPLSFGNVNFFGCSGVSGPAFLDDETIFLNFLNGDVFRLPGTGGAATTASKLSTIGPTLGWPVVGRNGLVYATRVATDGNFTTGAVVEIDPETGAQIREVASDLRCQQGLAIDPLSGDLFTTGQCFGAGSDDSRVLRIRNPGSEAPTVEVYATLQTTPNGPVSFAPDGTLFVIGGYLNTSAQVLRIAGTDQPQPAAISPVPNVTSSYWVHVAEADENGEATALLTVSADGDLRLTDITDDTPEHTLVANDLAGGFVGPDGCLYAAAHGTTVYRVSAEGGACTFVGTAGKPSLGLSPLEVLPDPHQGAAQTFTASLAGVDDPEGIAIYFEVSGANAHTKMVRADESGLADFTYTAMNAGSDVIVASAEVDEEVITSPKARVTWMEGEHTTFLTLNPSPSTAEPGQTVTVAASLSDISEQPPVPIVGATIDFDLDGETCSAATTNDGTASCDVEAGETGVATLLATFDGDEEFLPSQDEIAFNVVGELVAGVCADTNESGTVTASDALFVLKTAVGSETCALCICDADGSGTITATDALRVLRSAVGQLIDLLCPACTAGATISR